MPPRPFQALHELRFARRRGGCRSSSIAALARELTVIIPAYNERASLADTIRSLQAQTVAVKAVIVVNDCSTDGTGDGARSMGVTVTACS